MKEIITLPFYQFCIIYWLGCFFLVISITFGYILINIKCDCNKPHKPQQHSIKIIKSTTDSRHLTSVIYIDLKDDTIAMDYLTYEELRNLH